MFKESPELFTSTEIGSGSSYSTSRRHRKPFLKWVGGKTQLLPALLKHIPRNYNKYIEPFIGGGALFFELAPTPAVISDLNEELIVTYQAVKEDVSTITSILEEFVNDEAFFYELRAIDPTCLSNPYRAARLIYLNKTCFNGLYRVNKKGAFNVPYNKTPGRNFFDRQALLQAHEILKKTRIVQGTYEDTLRKYARKGDLVFLDPPYQPIGKFSDFKRYTKEFFYEKDQVTLATNFKRLVDRGCNVILTNSTHPLIFELYKDFFIETVPSKRLVSRDPNTRIGEDVIVVGGI